jgi:RNA polymerase sigma-70 factor, ECF subfamily
MDLSEAECVEQAKAGSRPAFSQLLRLHQAHVRAFLGRFVRGSDVVEDLAQEAFLRAYRGLSGYRGDSPFRIWLLGIARNQALMHLREEQRRRTTGLEGFLARLIPDRVAASDAEPAHQERRIAALKGCLKTLPESSAGLVKSHYYARRSAQEIAQESGRTEGAVWIALLRVRKSLRECIDFKLASPQVKA